MPSSEPIQEAEIVCPYCGEAVIIALEADVAGELVQDCEVCCRPWLLRIGRTAGHLAVEATRLDE